MNEREEIERRVIDYSMAVDLNLNRKDTRKALMSAIDRALAKRDARIAVLENALRAACKLYHGRAHFITAQGVVMEMPEKAEQIVRYALATEQPHE